MQQKASNVAALVDVFPATWNAAVVWYVIMMNQLCLQFVQAQGSRVLYQVPSHQHQLNTCPERVSVCVCVHSYFCSLNTAAVCCHTVCTVYSCRSCCFLVRLVSSGTWFACQTPVGVGVCVCVRAGVSAVCCVMSFYRSGRLPLLLWGATTTHACAHTHSSLQVYFCVSPSLPWPYACGLFIFAIGL